MPTFKSGLAVSASPLASRAGATVMKKGGNAIDAAITMAHVIGVVAPAFSGIGGGGFALIWVASEQKAIFVDFRERAPFGAHKDVFKLTASGKVLRKENEVGYKAVAVPGALSGHASILEKYGTLKFGDTLEQAARIAKRGFQIGRALAFVWKLGNEKLQRFHETKTTYLKNGHPYREGDNLAIPALAHALQDIRRKGTEEFYTGAIGRKLVNHVASCKGLISSRDLEDFKPTTREPIRGSYKDYEIISAPPPSVGGAIILQTLNIMENFPLNTYGNESPETLHLLAEALARSSNQCRSTIADPNFTSLNMEELVSKAIAKDEASTISLNHASVPSKPNLETMPASNTTHLVAVDASHNIVSLTESLECYFGSGTTVPGTGILLNDTMHDFEPRPNLPNSVGPGKIPMSNMSPTIVLREGKPILALGSAGGPRIVSSTLETLLNVIEYDMPLGEAVGAPRLHLNGTTIELEQTIAENVPSELRKMGHSTKLRKRTGKDDPGLYFGGVHAAQILDDDSLTGAPDPRRDGLAVGLP